MSLASIELRDLKLQTAIDTYGPGAIIPKQHLLDLTLWIDARLVLISEDVMANVFDYDPLVIEIDRLAGDGHYETQERLITRIVEACAKYPEIKAMDIDKPGYESSRKTLLGIKGKPAYPTRKRECHLPGTTDE